VGSLDAEGIGPPEVTGVTFDEIRKLGAKAAKELPTKLLDITDDAPAETTDDGGEE
jgi:arginase family enzyme